MGALFRTLEYSGARLVCTIAAVVQLSGCAQLTMPFDDNKVEAIPSRPATQSAPGPHALSSPSGPTPQAPATSLSPVSGSATVATAPAMASAPSTAAPPLPSASASVGTLPDTGNAHRHASSPAPQPAPAAQRVASTPPRGTAGEVSAPAPAAGGARSAPPRVGPSSGRSNPASAQAQAELAPGKGYALQVGAFKTEAAATAWRDEVAARLNGESPLRFTPRESSIRVVERDGIFRVFVGELDSVAAARHLKSRLGGTVPNSFITRPN